MSWDPLYSGTPLLRPPKNNDNNNKGVGGGGGGRHAKWSTCAFIQLYKSHKHSRSVNSKSMHCVSNLTERVGTEPRRDQEQGGGAGLS